MKGGRQHLPAVPEVMVAFMVGKSSFALLLQQIAVFTVGLYQW